VDELARVARLAKRTEENFSTMKVRRKAQPHMLNAKRTRTMRFVLKYLEGAAIFGGQSRRSIARRLPKAPRARSTLRECLPTYQTK